MQDNKYLETYASVVKPISYKALFATVAAKDYEIEQIDVKTAFLYRELNYKEEPIYIEQLEGIKDLLIEPTTCVYCLRRYID